MEPKAHFERLEKIEKDVEVLFTNTKLKEMKKTVILVIIISAIVVFFAAVGRPVFWAIDTRYGSSSFQSRPAVLEPPTLSKPLYQGDAKEGDVEELVSTAEEAAESGEVLEGEIRDSHGGEEPEETRDEAEETKAGEELEEATIDEAEEAKTGETPEETTGDEPEGAEPGEENEDVSSADEDASSGGGELQPAEAEDEAELPDPSRKLLRSKR